MTTGSTRIAFYKTESNKTIPLRHGPLQYIRSCANCVMDSDTLPCAVQEIINLKSYDNLLLKTRSRLESYQTIQFHPAQVDILMTSIKANNHAIYVVGVTDVNDIRYLKMLFEYLNWQMPKDIPMDYNRSVPVTFLTVCFKSCSSPVESKKELLSPTGLLNTIQPAFEDGNLTLIPITITKDHNQTKTRGLGSVCIQILEPYHQSSYALRIEPELRLIHLVKHVFHDMAVHAGILPSHLVAFLLLYTSTEDFISRETLVENLNWFRSTSTDNDMKLCFTGSTQDVVDFGLLVLKDHVIRRNSTFMPRDVISLEEYANLITPIMAYQAIVARCILYQYNNQVSFPKFTTNFALGTRVKVLKDEVVDASIKLANRLEKKLPIRKPCLDVETCVLNTIQKMQTFGHFFRVEEPTMKPRYKCGWAGDSEDDDDYWLNNRDNPKMKAWIVLTERDYRIKRLNLLLNSIERYC